MFEVYYFNNFQFQQGSIITQRDRGGRDARCLSIPTRFNYNYIIAIIVQHIMYLSIPTRFNYNFEKGVNSYRLCTFNSNKVQL